MYIGIAESFLNQSTNFILSLILLGGVVRQGRRASPPSTAVTCLFSAEIFQILVVENKFIQFKTNSIPVCTNDQATISGEDNTIFNIYLKKDKVITFIIDH